MAICKHCVRTGAINEALEIVKEQINKVDHLTPLMESIGGKALMDVQGKTLKDIYRQISKLKEDCS